MCLAEGEEGDEEAQPPIPSEELKLAKCTHYGAKNWNILGDATTGYVLSEGDGKVCLVRDAKTNTAMTVDCNSEE